jgi:hypothetical protein
VVQTTGAGLGGGCLPIPPKEGGAGTLRNQPRYQASHFGAVNHLSRMHGSIAIAFDLRDYSCYIYAA